jgi:hypothetical protein
MANKEFSAIETQNIIKYVNDQFYHSARRLIGAGVALPDLGRSTTSPPLLPSSIAAAMCLPTASRAAFIGSSAR